ncbi:MAG: hypothetical protein CMB80_05655 [Flammeovirgaceae bacterium]|nr:hypothetical protein [Flammeovirgaceae bacterium]|tara:strand:+ start:354 stop:866 length:513 start_codon:yes stop_codon:yes gene_type:complete
MSKAKRRRKPKELIKIRLPFGGVSTLNAYRNQHYYKKNNEKKRWADLVYKALAKAGVDATKLRTSSKKKRKREKTHWCPYQFRQPVELIFVFHYPDNRVRDLDGMAVYEKYSGDALEDYDLIEADDRRYVMSIRKYVGTNDAEGKGYVDLFIRPFDTAEFNVLLKDIKAD